MYSTSCGNTHHDIKDFEVNGMVRNIKDGISQERKMNWVNTFTHIFL